MLTVGGGVPIAQGGVVVGAIGVNGAADQAAEEAVASGRPAVRLKIVTGRSLVSRSPEIIRLFYELWEATLPGREYILAAESLESLDKVPRSEAANVQRALRHLNRLGHLIAKGVLDAQFAASLIGREVIRTVVKLQPALEEARSRRADPQYMEFVDALLQACREAFPDYEPRYYAEERRRLGLST
jgi:hypothetical protein